MSNELTIVENRPLTKADVIAQKRLIREVMESVMKDGTHYGVIPGCKQPSLFKAGSEAILSTFRIAVDPVVEDLSTHDCYRYRVTLRGILPSGEIVGAGVGECSTDEEKYKWRGIVCDAEYDSTPDDRRRIKYSKPTNWNKEGVTKQVRTNPADLANTVLKMAKKRAQIDLTLTATGASDVFVQDLEDLPEEIRDELVTENIHKQGSKPAVAQPQSKPPQQSQSTDNSKPVTEAQAKMLFAKLKNKEVSVAAFCAHYKIAELKDLPFSQMNPALKAIDAGEIAESHPASSQEEKQEELPEICSNCGEQIDENGGGHHPDCPASGN